jgi:oligosaccharide repeat unit polymerase
MSLKNILVESRTFNAVEKSVVFLENSTKDSKILAGVIYFLNFIYPQRFFDRIDTLNQRQMSFLSRNIFSPLVIFPIIYILFISISNYRLSNTALLTVGIGLLFFYVGARYSSYTFKEIKLNEETKRIGIFFFSVGLLFLAADLIKAQAIPLLFPSARSRLVVLYTMLAQLIPPGGIFLIAYYGERYRKGEMELKRARINALTVFFVTVVLISTLGFRTQIILTIYGSFIAMYLTGLVGFVEVIFSLGLVGFLVVFLGYVRALMQGSPIGFFEVIGARVGLTLSVYDYLVKRFMPFGANKGYTLLASFSSFIPGIPGPRQGPRTIVAGLFGITGISVTSTLLGTVVLDLGIVGVILFMLVLGHVLGTGYRAAKTGFALGVGIYSVLLAYALVGIETGLVDFNVLVMFLAGYLVLRSSTRT